MEARTLIEIETAKAYGALLRDTCPDCEGWWDTALEDECHDCGLDALVEVHDAVDLERAYSVGASMMGVNNRDLRTLDVDLSVTEELGALIGSCVLFVSESGIGAPRDARRVRAAGAQAILVGEALLGTPHEHLAAAMASLRGVDAPGGDA